MYRSSAPIPGELLKRRRHRRVAAVQPVHRGDVHLLDTRPGPTRAETLSRRELRHQRCIGASQQLVRGQIVGRYNKIYSTLCVLNVTLVNALSTVRFVADHYESTIASVHVTPTVRRPQSTPVSR